MILRKYDGHPIMHRRDDVVGVGGEDGEGARPGLGLRIAPRFVEAGEEQQAPVRRVVPERAARFLRARPLEEAIGRDDAAPRLEGVAERGAGAGGLGLGVDLTRRALHVGRPGVHEPELRGEELALLLLHAQDPVLVRRRDVVARAVERDDGVVELRAELGGELAEVLAREGHAAAHGLQDIGGGTGSGKQEFGGRRGL